MLKIKLSAQSMFSIFNLHFFFLSYIPQIPSALFMADPQLCLSAMEEAETGRQEKLQSGSEQQAHI